MTRPPTLAQVTLPEKERPISDVFVAIARLATALGAAPLTKQAGCWTHTFEIEPGMRWSLAVNGHKEPHDVEMDGNTTTVPPFECFVTYNGWPFALLNPYGGAIMGGDLANEDSFLVALKAAQRQAGAS